jgi:hypothetical protein
MTRAIWIYTAVNLTVMGISHIAAPMAWTRYFIWLRGKGHAGVFIVAAMSLVFGAPIVAFHEVWSGWPLAVTLVGWAQVLKATLYFTFPAYGLRKLEIVREERSWIFIPAGVLLLLLAAPAWYLLIRAGWPTPP